MSPLVSRPAYGVVGESGLPGGGPADKGLPVDSGLPGSKTFAKPSDEGPREPDIEDESIHRVDDADDLLKDRSRIDTREDNADKHDGIGYNGEGPYDGTGKTKYPYREDRRHTKIALDLTERTLLARRPLVAMTLGDIVRGVDHHVEAKARSCRVSVKTREPGLFTFSVRSSGPARLVRLRADGVGLLRDVPLRVACSCPAWVWQGPEHHARREGYLEGSPKGTAASPRERDPHGEQRICKHVAAVLELVKGWRTE